MHTLKSLNDFNYGRLELEGRMLKLAEFGAKANKEKYTLA
jgi:hypothetical protein